MLRQHPQNTARIPYTSDEAGRSSAVIGGNDQEAARTPSLSRSSSGGSLDFSASAKPVTPPSEGYPDASTPTSRGDGRPGRARSVSEPGETGRPLDPDTAAAMRRTTLAGGAAADEDDAGARPQQLGSPVEEMTVMPAPRLTTPLIINGVVVSSSNTATPVQQPRPTATDWLSGLFSGLKQLPRTPTSDQRTAAEPPSSSASSRGLSPMHRGAGYEAFNEKAFQAHLEEQGKAMEAREANGGKAGDSYYR